MPDLVHENKICRVNDRMYFYFALPEDTTCSFEREIALVVTDERETKQYILNANETLWEAAKVAVGKDRIPMFYKMWWKVQSYIYETNEWSADFDDLT